jgi:hypothetical protein
MGHLGFAGQTYITISICLTYTNGYLLFLRSLISTIEGGGISVFEPMTASYFWLLMLALLFPTKELLRTKGIWGLKFGFEAGGGVVFAVYGKKSWRNFVELSSSSLVSLKMLDGIWFRPRRSVKSFSNWELK